jgi:hypothetical protein
MELHNQQVDEFLKSWNDNIWGKLSVTPEERQQFYSNLLRTNSTIGAQQANRASDIMAYNRAPLATQTAAQNQIGYNTLLTTSNQMGELEKFFQGMDANAMMFLLNQQLERDKMKSEQDIAKWSAWGNLLDDVGEAAGSWAAGKI